MGLTSGHPEDIWPKEGDYSAWVAWGKGKIGLPDYPFLFPLLPMLPRQSIPPLLARYIRGALAAGPMVSALSLKLDGVGPVDITPSTD